MNTNDNNAKTLPVSKEVIQKVQEHTSIISVESPSLEPEQQEKEAIQVSGSQHLPAVINVTSNTTGIKPIAPNSGQPLYKPLIGLNVDQMMHMVLSNVFVPPEVRYNTIIWEHWDDVFSKALYHWKVVRGHPSVVKLTGQFREHAKNSQMIPMCITCSQVKKKQKELFEVKLFTFANVKFDHFEKDLYESMYDAITDCESYLAMSKESLFFPTSWHETPSTRNMKSLYLNDSLYDVLTENMSEAEADEVFMKDFSMTELQNLGVDDKTIQYLVKKRSISLIETALGILTQDIEPTDEELGGLSNKDYPYVDMLSRQEISDLYRARSIRGKRGMRENKLKDLLRKMNSNFDVF